MLRNPRIEGLTDWRPLARGGFAVVWEARQESLNRLVAVKVDERKLDSVAERERFLREAGAAGRMSGHPGIVTVHDAGLLPDDRPYLVMELCTGGSLTRRLRPDDRPSQEWVRDVGIRIADALAAAHAQGVLHRDVKPANVLIDQYGHAGLADFGLAVMPDPGMELAETLEALTPAYAPPEAFVPHSPTQSGDVYSLAATLYALLCGHAPRASADDSADDTRNVDTALARLETPVAVLPGVDRSLMDALLAALHTDPTRRPSAAELRDRLTSLPLGAPVEPVILPRPPAVAPASNRPLSNGPGPRDAGSKNTGANHPEPGVLTAAGARPGGRRTPDQLNPALLGIEPPPAARRRRWIVPTAAAAAVLVVVLALLGYGAGGGGATASTPSTGASVSAPGQSTPVTTGTAPSTSVSAAPSSSAPTSSSAAPAATPVGFVDCSQEVGSGVLCGPSPPQCWGGLTSYADSPFVATAADCDANHVYQTFVAGPLDFTVRRQSQLDNDPVVKRTCTVELVNQMLPESARRPDWEVFAIPPQTERADDTYFRCIFGKGERTEPFTLVKPS